MANKVAATPALVDAVRERAAAGPAEFFMLVPNPGHLAFDRVSPDMHEGRRCSREALPELEQAAGGEIDGRVARARTPTTTSCRARRGEYAEIILETPPSHVSHWLHVDLPQRVALLGYPLVTVAATH